MMGCLKLSAPFRATTGGCPYGGGATRAKVLSLHEKCEQPSPKQFLIRQHHEGQAVRRATHRGRPASRSRTGHR